MNKLPTKETSVSNSRRQLLLFPFAILASHLLPTSVIAAEPDAITTRKVEEGCPLNSGGTSLLNTQWRIHSVYGNIIPRAAKINMKVNQHSLTGLSGCNTYSASFQQVGNTGFRVSKINKGAKGCQVIRPVKGGRTINLGDLEGGYLRTLQRMGSVQHVNNQLVFYNRSGAKGIIMTPL